MLRSAQSIVGLVTLSLALAAYGQATITADARTSQFNNFTTQTVTQIGTTVTVIPQVAATASNSVASASANAQTFRLSVSCSGRNSGIGLPEAQAEADDSVVMFFDTPAYRALVPAGQDGLDIYLNYHVTYRASCTFSFNNDQCGAFLNPQWVVRFPFVSISGYLQYAHDSLGFHHETDGIFETKGFQQDDMIVSVPARVFIADKPFTPKLTARVGVARTNCHVLSVLSSTSSLAEMTIELRDDPSAITLRDGTPLSTLGVQYRILPYIPPPRHRAVRH